MAIKQEIGDRIIELGGTFNKIYKVLICIADFCICYILVDYYELCDEVKK